MDVRRTQNETGNLEVPVVSSNTAKGNGGLAKTLTVLLIIAAIVFIGAYTFQALNNVTADSAVKRKLYQAVFLTNGQVYFGKMSKVAADYVVLKDIFYLQVQQTVQPKDTTNTSPQVSLAKLGGELHGPEDVMYINSSQVLFWENLKADGKVTKAITDYKAQGSK